MALSNAMSNVLSSIIGLGGSLGSAFIASSGSRGSQARAYNYQKMLQEQQFELQQRGFRENLLDGYAHMREGLQRAGYNPILAATDGKTFSGPSISMGGVGTDSPNIPDFGTTLTNAYKTLQLERKNTEANVKNANAQADYYTQQAVTEANKRANLDMDSALKQAQKIKTDKESSWVDKKTASEVEKNINEAKLARNQAQVVDYNATTARIASNAQQQNANYGSWSRVAGGLVESALDSKFMKKHPQLAKKIFNRSLERRGYR